MSAVEPNASPGGRPSRTRDEAQTAADLVEADGQTEIEDAKRKVVAAQNLLSAAVNDEPADVSVQEAAVAEAAAAVVLAERDLENAVLKRTDPRRGRRDQWQRWRVRGPDGGQHITVSREHRAAAHHEPVARRGQLCPGAGAFIVLDDVDTFQTVASFEEGAAVNIAPNQRAEVSVAAVPGLVKPGTVLAVAPTGGTRRGVVRFAVTIVLAEGDPRMRDGQTADVSVFNEAAKNVLRVPSAAVIRENGRTVVRVPGPPGGEPIVVPFEAGIAGDDFTEVRGGLEEGQVVLVP